MPSNNDSSSGRSGPLLLLILDGVGLGDSTPANAFFQAKTPTLDRVFSGPLFGQLKAHGKAVGMPSDADMGNSEVGHNALGAGRVFDQGASLVKKAFDSMDVFTSPTYKKLRLHCRENVSTLHTIGLLSDGNVHSHIDHLFALTQQACKDGIRRIRCHILLDGRDVAGRSALGYIDSLESHLAVLRDQGCDARIASGGGRMTTTMDRYNAEWDMVERGWRAQVLGEADPYPNASAAVQSAYDLDVELIDQYIPPFTIVSEGEAIGCIEDGDAVVMMNFRGDRAIELSQAFEEDEFTRFERYKRPNVLYVGMMQYDGDTRCPRHFLVSPPKIDYPLGEHFCAHSLRTLAISETQKYGHVTYFWNGNRSGYMDKSLETYIEIPSDTLPFDHAPAMKAKEIAQETLRQLKTGKFDFARVNFPNGDMVGHTGNLEAAILAMETIDQQVAYLLEAMNTLGGVTVILADHGNCDLMYTENKGIQIPHTAHTLAPVPFAIVDPLYQGDYALNIPEGAGLANVAATLCQLLGIAVPRDYEPGLLGMK
ncbi:MAG: 2,3-bisphosphoglycerate-independent phosphoglycerate mutase [bacterium]